MKPQNPTLYNNLTLEQNFHQFRSLPPEIRNMIWKFSLPRARIFKPYVLDYPCGTVLLDMDSDLPSVRAVCHESRQVCDSNGRFLHEVCGSTRHGWFNFAIDEVFIHIDTLDCMPHMRLDCVEILAFPQCLFTTRVKCLWFLKAMQQWAPKCRIVRMYLCSSNVNYGRYLPWNSNADLPELDDLDLVGKCPLIQEMGGTGNTWLEFRHAVVEVWEDDIKRFHTGYNIPKLVGMRARCC